MNESKKSKPNEIIYDIIGSIMITNKSNQNE